MLQAGMVSFAPVGLAEAPHAEAVLLQLAAAVAVDELHRLAARRRNAQPVHQFLRAPVQIGRKAHRCVNEMSDCCGVCAAAAGRRHPQPVHQTLCAPVLAGMPDCQEVMSTITSGSLLGGGTLSRSARPSMRLQCFGKGSTICC